jgi:hypothetical protein
MKPTVTPEQIPEQLWQEIQRRLGYTDEELALFRANPRNTRVVAGGAAMAAKTIVFEVVHSRGCHAEHGAGTHFFFTGDGQLISKLAPKRVCAFLVPAMSQVILSLQELSYAGVDPNTMEFPRAGCVDIGLECGGWGRVIVEGKVLDRDEAARLAAAGRSSGA